MKRTIYATLAILSLTIVAPLEAASIRVVGHPDSAGSVIRIVPGQALVDVPIEILGGELINNFDIGLAVGDGGPIFGGVETIGIVSVDFHAAGSIWPVAGFTELFPNPALPAQSATVTGGAITNPVGGEVAADGLLLLFTLDVSSVSSSRLGETIPLDLNAGGLTVIRDSANTPLPLSIDVSGSLQVVPEPSTIVYFSLGLLALVTARRRHSHRTTLHKRLHGAGECQP